MNVYLWFYDDTQPANGWVAVGWYNNLRGPVEGHGIRTTTGEQQVKAQLEAWAVAGYHGWWCTQSQQGNVTQGRYEAKPADYYAGYAADPVQSVGPDGTLGPWLV